MAGSPCTRIGDSTSGSCDLGIPDCCGHGRSGINATGSENVYINGIPAHRLGDKGPCRCPHGGTFVSDAGAPRVFVNGRNLTRVGDSTTCMSCGCGGCHVAGSPNVFA